MSKFHHIWLRDHVQGGGQHEALDLLCDFASNESTFERCGSKFIDAPAALDTPRSREVLLSFVDPNIREQPFSQVVEHEFEICFGVNDDI